MDAETGFTIEEVQLALRNHGMPLEALRYPITPVGLHYLLTHYDIPEVDAGGWRLSIEGSVDRPVVLSLPDLRARPSLTLPVTLECAGNGRALLSPRPVSQPWISEAVGTIAWTGTPLRGLLEEAGVGSAAVEVLFTGLDSGVEDGVELRYERSLSVEEAMREEVLLAYSANGEALPPQHGYPLRLVVPGWYGMTHVKWLEKITVLDEPFAGFQQAGAYRIWDSSGEGEGEPVTRILPRSLMEPPGIPDFMSRTRFVDPSPMVLTGRAWSGWGPIASVEVSTDGGRSWGEAILGEPPSPFAWHPWTFEWQPSPGEYVISSRATDATGRTQPLEDGDVWNLKGYLNNSVQRVPVLVRTPPP
jgi:sulfane dehydrogenase subunit SoxC